MLDPKIIIMIAGFALQIILLIVNIIKTNTIKNNDLHHLGLTVKDILKAMESMGVDVKNNAINIANITGYLAAKGYKAAPKRKKKK